jgi:hypothetical protein
MTTNPILEEIWAIREELGQRHHHDLDAIFLEIKRREKARGLIFVDGVARQADVIESPTSPNIEVLSVSR